MTTPTGSGDISSLEIQVNATQPLVAAENMDVMSNSGVKLVKNLGELGTASDVSAKALEKISVAGRVTVDELRRYNEMVQKLIASDAAHNKIVAETTAGYNRFMSKLQEMNATLGMSQVEMLKYTAAQLGATDAAAPLIASIEAQSAAFGKVEYAAYRAMEAQEATYLKATSSAEYAALREMEANEAVYLKKVAARAKDEASLGVHIQAEIAANKAKTAAIEYGAQREMEVSEQSYLKQTAAAEYASLKAMEANEAVYLKRTELRKVDDAALEAHVQKEIAANKAITASAEYAALRQMEVQEQLYLKKEAAHLAGVVAAEKEAMDEIRWNTMSVKARIAELEKLKAYQASGSIRQETVQGMFSAAAIKDLPNLTALTDQYNASLARTHRGHGAVTDSTNTLSSAFNNNRVRTEALVIAHEGLQGRFTKIPGSLMVMAEYANIASTGLFGMGIGTLGAAVAVAALGYEMQRGQAQTKAFTDAIARTNGYSGETRDSLEALAQSVGKVHGNYKEAYEAAAELTNSGKFTASQIDVVTEAVVSLHHAFGEPIKDSVKEFESLVIKGTSSAVIGTFQVTKAVEKLDEKYHFLTVSVMEQIIALEQEGKYREASALAIAEFAKASKVAADESVQNIGWIALAWQNVTKAVNGTLQAMADIGKKSSDAAKEATLLNRLEKNKDGSLKTDESHMSKSNILLLQEYYGLEKKISDLNDKAATRSKETVARSDADHALAMRAVEDFRLMKKSKGELQDALDRNSQATKVIEAADPGYTERNAQYLKDRELAIIKAHTTHIAAAKKDGYNIEFNNELKHIDEEYKLSKEATESNEKLVKGAIHARTIDEATGYETLRKGRDTELLALDRWLKERNAVIEKHKPRTSADRAHQDGLKTDGADKFLNYSNDIKAASAANDAKEVDDKAIAYAKVTTAIDRANNHELEALDKAIAKQREHNLEIGKTKEQIELARATAEKAYAESNEREAEAISWVLQETSIRGNMTKQDVELYEGRLAFLDRLIAKQREFAKAHEDGAAAQSAAPDTVAKAATLAAQQWKTAGDIIGKSLEDGFGKGAKSVGNLFKAYANGQTAQIKLERDWKKTKAESVGLANEEGLVAAANSKYATESAQARMNEYGNMASAAAGFFDKQSMGYKTLTAVSQVFHAAELAMSIAELVPKALGAILNQGNGDPYTAFGRMAAMGAFVAGLGIAVGGIGGGGKEDTTAKDRQAATGTGTVLGNSTAASDSIAKSLKLIEKDSGLGLVHSQAMVNSLQAIESGIGNLGNLVARQTGLTDPNNTMGVNEKPGNKIFSAASMKEGAKGAAIGAMLAGPIGAITGAFLGATAGKLFHVGRVTVLDTGIMSSAASYGGVKSGASLNAKQYADVKTEGYFSNDFNRKTQALSAEVNNQFTLIIKNMGEAVTESAKSLGLAGTGFEARLNSFVVNIGDISSKGLTSDEYQKKLEAAFSKVGDSMTSWAVGNITRFAAAGEGPLETLVRVASDVQGVKDVYAAFGKELLRIGTSAIATSEDLIKVSGGLDKLTSGAKFFIDNFMTESEKLAPVAESLKTQLTSLRLFHMTTVEQYKQQVLAALDGTAAGNDLYNTLIKLAPAFDMVGKAEAARYDSQLSLQAKLADLEKNTEAGKIALNKQRAVELKALDSTLRPLQLRVWALEDEAAATDKASAAKTKLNDAYTKESDALKSTVDTMQTWSKALRTFADSQLLGSQTTLTPDQKYQESSGQYATTLAKAKTGDKDAQNALQAAMTTFLTASQVSNSNDAQYVQDFNKVQADARDAAKWAQAQVDVAQASLTALERQVSGLIDVKEAVLSVRDAISEYIATLYPVKSPALIASESALTSQVAPGYNASDSANAALVKEVKSLKDSLDALRTERMEGDNKAISSNVKVTASTFNGFWMIASKILHKAPQPGVTIV